MLKPQSPNSNSYQQFTILSTPPEYKMRIKNDNNTLKFIIAGLTVIIIILIIVLIILSLNKYRSYKPQRQEITERSIIRKNNTYWNNLNLPNFAKPKHYSITLQLLKEAFTQKEHEKRNYFFGNVVIDIEMKEDSKFLVLNIKELKIISIKMEYIFQNLKIKSLKVFRIINDNVFQQVILIFNETLINSWHYSLNITYSGNITLSEDGIVRTFYRSFLLNKTYDILYSELEPIGARTMFPCFDEPDKKALFTVKIIHFSKYTALSNMPLRERKNINKESLIIQDVSIKNLMSITLSSFNTTFIYMSTYLVAFVLMEDYEKIERERKPNFNVAIWGPKGIQSTNVKVLEYCILIENSLERFLDFNSPMQQSQHIYIPSSLSGAMENWGLITYKDNRLIMHPRQEESISEKGYMTIAHELAHMWFGNWLTMKSWTDLWLNEGFATYFASRVYYTQLNISADKSKELFVFQRRIIMENDGESKAFPVRLKVFKFSELFNLFTYLKGQAMLVWLNSIMGGDKFIKGIQSYIKKYSQNNPTTKDFFQEMQRKGSKDTAFNMSFDEYFDPWLNKIGYPILSINYDTSNKQLLLSQKSAVSNSSEKESWPIYTLIKTNSFNFDKPILLKGKNYKMNLTLGEQDFVIINSDGTSYIRVNYGSYLWGKIINNLRENNKNISSINKIILFDDYFFFAYSGLINISITKDLMDILVNETNSVLWKLFYNRIFTKMYDLFRDDRIFLKWTKYVKQLSKKALEKAFTINVDGDLDVDAETFQKQLFLLNCEIDNQEMLDYFSKKFKIWINSPKNQTLPKHLVTLILYYGIRENDKEEYWMKMWRMMIENNESSLINKDQIAIGLAGTSRSYRLNKLLNYILTPGTHNSDYNKQTFVSGLVSWVLRSGNGLNALSRWILKKSIEIKKYAFGDNVSSMKGIRYFDNLLVNIAILSYDLDSLLPLSKLHSNKNDLVKILRKNFQWKENMRKILYQCL